VRVLLRNDGTLNLADLGNPKNVPPSTGEEESPRVDIERLSVATGRVAFEDRARAQAFATEFRPITFELRDFSTGGASGNAYSLHGASVDGETFSWSGNFALKPLSTSGKFEVGALKPTTIWSYLREGLPFEFTKGTLDLNGEYFYTASEQGGLRFAIHKIGVADFGMRPPGKDHDYIEVASLAPRGDRRLGAHQPREHRARASRRRRGARGARCRGQHQPQRVCGHAGRG
jgi:hypothetical protein